MEIIEHECRIEVFKDNKRFSIIKPSFEAYDYVDLVKKLVNLGIYQIRIGFKSCNVVSEKKILTKLKKLFPNRVIFHGNYKFKNYSYNIKILNEKEMKDYQN